MIHCNGTSDGFASKVYKKNFSGRAYDSHKDDLSYKLFMELIKILNPIDENGESCIRDTYNFKEMLAEIQIEEGCIFWKNGHSWNMSELTGAKDN